MFKCISTSRGGTLELHSSKIRGEIVKYETDELLTYFNNSMYETLHPDKAKRILNELNVGSVE